MLDYGTLQYISPTRMQSNCKTKNKNKSVHFLLLLSWLRTLKMRNSQTFETLPIFLLPDPMCNSASSQLKFKKKNVFCYFLRAIFGQSTAWQICYLHPPQGSRIQLQKPIITLCQPPQMALADPKLGAEFKRVILL